MIPFFSLLIKDIYFLNEGCATRLPNGHINFEVGVQKTGVSFSSSQLELPLGGLMAPPCGSETLCTPPLTFAVSPQKLWELAKQVSEFLVWRQVICPFERDRRILQYLVTTPVFSEDGQSPSLFFPSTVLELSLTDCVCWVPELHLASYDSEGPENNLEKDSRRSLR